MPWFEGQRNKAKHFIRTCVDISQVLDVNLVLAIYLKTHIFIMRNHEVVQIWIHRDSLHLFFKTWNTLSVRKWLFVATTSTFKEHIYRYRSDSQGFYLSLPWLFFRCLFVATMLTFKQYIRRYWTFKDCYMNVVESKTYSKSIRTIFKTRHECLNVYFYKR